MKKKIGLLNCQPRDHCVLLIYKEMKEKIECGDVGRERVVRPYGEGRRK